MHVPAAGHAEVRLIALVRATPWFMQALAQKRYTQRWPGVRVVDC